MDIKKFLCEMSESPGISGYEHDLAQKISENCPWADETRSDKLGNLILLKRGKDDQNCAQNYACCSYGRDRFDGNKDRKRRFYSL